MTRLLFNSTRDPWQNFLLDLGLNLELDLGLDSREEKRREEKRREEKRRDEKRGEAKLGHDLAVKV